jgi:hypothetical protein
MVITRLSAAAAAATAAGALIAVACSSDKPGPGPTPTAALDSVSLNPSTVVAPGTVQGTVSLTAAAPAGGANVSLSSSSAAATVPPSVTIASGSASTGFSVATSGSGSATITASYLGVTRTAQLTVNPGLVANFTVQSTMPARRRLANGTVEDIPGLGTGSADACPLVAGQGTARFLACSFNGSTSTATGSTITQYQWTYKFGTQSVTENTSGPTLVPAVRDCGFFGGAGSTSSGGLTFVAMVVELRVLNAQNQLSDIKSNQNVRIFPAGNCGYAF